jgi:trehalose-6-phosphate synthase
MELSADLILANRAYLDHDAPRGADTASPGSNGGLLAAVRPVIAPWDGANGTTWVGAACGAFDREWTDSRGFEIVPTEHGPLRHRRLYIDTQTWRDHYATVANGFFWPLLHLVREPLPDRTTYYPRPEIPAPAQWSAYTQVNAAFADAAAEEEASPPRTCWVHDYQLALVPAMLRERAYQRRIGFFLHTPFPDIAVAGRYLNDAGRESLRAFIAGILGADLVGLQSPADVERFCGAATALCAAEPISGGVRLTGRDIRVGPYPVGIDVDEVVNAARGASVSTRLGPVPPGIPLVVGLERSDYTKGIPERLEAVAAAYAAGLRFAYCGIAAPTREGVPAYDLLADVVEEAATRARAVAAASGLPFLHAREAIEWSEVVALQRDASVVFTSSLADGMNLVPLQAAVAQSPRPLDARGTLITGRDAGVASAFAGFEDEGLLIVDPLDPAAMLAALRRAIAPTAPRVSDGFVTAIRANDARAWATSFLTDLEDPC